MTIIYSVHNGVIDELFTLCMFTLSVITL